MTLGVPQPSQKRLLDVRFVRRLQQFAWRGLGTMDRGGGVVREVLSRALLGFIVRFRASQHSMTHEFGNWSLISRRTS